MTASPVAGTLTQGWDLAPSVLVPVALGVVLYVRGFLQLRGRGRVDLASKRHAIAFGGGIAAVMLALVSPLAGDANTSLLSHMSEHVLVGDVAPALIAASLAGPLFLFVVPRSVLTTIARRRRLRRAASVATRPAVAVSAWVAALAIWHVPSVYDAALASPVLHAVEHGSFFVAGLLVWTAMLDAAPRKRLTLGRRLAVAGCLFAGGQALADVLLFASPLYPSYVTVQQSGALHNQQGAALVMMGEQTFTLGLFGAWVLLHAFRGSPQCDSGATDGNPEVDSTRPSPMMVIAS